MLEREYVKVRWVFDHRRLLIIKNLLPRVIINLHPFFLKANDAYLQMAIGNAPWPIGVTMVGIHARTGREKIFSKHVAHVLNDETQRKYIQVRLWYPLLQIASKSFYFYIITFSGCWRSSTLLSQIQTNKHDNILSHLVFIFLTPGTEEADDHLPETLHHCSIQVCRVQCSLTCTKHVWSSSIVSLSEVVIFHCSSIRGSGLIEVLLRQNLVYQRLSSAHAFHRKSV